MNIICDTNIWYNIGNGNIKIDPHCEDNLIGVNPSIEELFRSDKIFSNIDYVINAIRAIMTHSRNNVRSLPPYAYIKKIDESSFNFVDPDGSLTSILEFTQRIANGVPLEGELRDEMYKVVEYRKKSLEEASTIFNNEANRIRPNIHDKREQKKVDRTELVRGFIRFSIESSLPKNKLSSEFDWHQIELFETLFGYFFLKMEISDIKMSANDWFDLFHLAYVHPGERYWTNEGRWINLIKEAGMAEYLYQN